MRYTKREPYREWRPWNMRDVSTLRQMWRKGSYDREIGAVLGRTRHEVGFKRRELGIPGVKYRGHTQETVEKIRAADRARWADPVLRVRMLAGVRKALAARWGNVE
jgi:hypothetical protein